ncbi:MAG: DNA methyltransferase [Firmicutes bacterium HGW-Firmicutes-13]|nr:MAG: DNA methyltransferase [Firmicutes bacterium HGW-Firmicutes-13]
MDNKNKSINKTKGSNNLDGKTWIRYSISIWNDISKNAEEIKLKHPAMFPASLSERLLLAFSQKNNRVLDPFMGTGSTLIAAVKNGRNAAGLDISKEYVELAQKRIESIITDPISKDKLSIIHDDARNLLNYIEPGSIDICITSPPYWNILKEQRSADKKIIRNYGELEEDLGNIINYQNYLKELNHIFEKVKAVLKPNAYCIVIIMDIRKKNKFYPLHMDLTLELINIGFYLDDLIIWDRRKEYNNLKPLGFPYVFRINKIHEYILIFKNDK